MFSGPRISAYTSWTFDSVNFTCWCCQKIGAERRARASERKKQSWTQQHIKKRGNETRTSDTISLSLSLSLSRQRFAGAKEKKTHRDSFRRILLQIFNLLHDCADRATRDVVHDDDDFDVFFTPLSFFPKTASTTSKGGLTNCSLSLSLFVVVVVDTQIVSKKKMPLLLFQNASSLVRSFVRSRKRESYSFSCCRRHFFLLGKKSRCGKVFLLLSVEFPIRFFFVM